MKWLRGVRHGSLSFAPGEARWLLADSNSEQVEVVESGVIQLPEATAIPSQEVFDEFIAPLFRDASVQWNVVVPSPTRTRVAELPKLEPTELASAARWQSEKVFSHLPGSVATSFELLGATGSTALLVAMPRTRVQHWVTLFEPLTVRPHRLEPFVTALTRASRYACADAASNAATAVLYADTGGAGVVIQKGPETLLVRQLPDGESDDPQDLLAGELGIRALLEAILACEDLYPRLQVSELLALGRVPDEWLQQASQAAQLEITPALTAGAGPDEGLLTPEILQEQRWFIPWGALWGGRS